VCCCFAVGVDVCVVVFLVRRVVVLACSVLLGDWYVLSGVCVCAVLGGVAVVCSGVCDV